MNFPSSFNPITILSYGLICILLIGVAPAISQRPGGPPGGAMQGGKMPSGRFYGKVIDGQGHGVGYATIELYKTVTDPATKEKKEELVTGQITSDNGDFSLEDVPAMGRYTMKISFIGFTEISQSVSFLNPGYEPKPGERPSMADMNLDKDLGNIALTVESEFLSEVTVTAEKAQFSLAIDKKEYRVDKDAMAAGGDAIDALKNIPSLSVDLDGNVSLRNGSPQIFVDGRPTTLTLDQIAADMIETVEVITNPSAKYDAGGGTAGIINIVLKKDRRLGYNGNVRAGTDTRGGFNFGANLNARGEKTNFFISSFANERKSISNGESFQQNLTGDPLTSDHQVNKGNRNGLFGNVRTGIDWFMDNRNTLTFSASYTKGKFDPTEVLTTTTDSLFNTGTRYSEYIRTSEQDRSFQNTGGSILFKHLFPKQGAEWTADINFNRVRFEGDNQYFSQFSSGRESMEFQNNLGIGQFVTIQSDFVNPLSAKIKIEGGIRAALRKNSSENKNAFINSITNEREEVARLTDEFSYTDNVFAAYGSMSHQLNSWAYQVGLRAESSFYTGTLDKTGSSFDINYPISLFPSVFVTKQLNDQDNLQLSYTRRINRPNFFQTLPFTDISNPLNPRRGNTELRPEFTNSLEFSYQNIIGDNHNLLVSVYYKQADDLITSFLSDEYVPELNTNALVSTYANSNSSSAIGTELTVKNSFGKNWELTSNVNLYQSRVDASNVENNLVIDRFSWFMKENLTVKLPAGFTFQLSGQYRSKASFIPSSGEERGHGRGSSNSAQGYELGNWFADAALRKDLMNRNLTVTLNVNDIFASRKTGSYTESALFIQESFRYNDAQIFRLNLSYRFGKTDGSLFKRKNNQQNSGGGDMM